MACISAFLRSSGGVQMVKDHTLSCKTLQCLENICFSDLLYKHCPNYWFKHRRLHLSRNQYAFSFKLRLRKFVWEPRMEEVCCFWRNEPHYLEFQDWHEYALMFSYKSIGYLTLRSFDTQKRIQSNFFCK